MTQTVVDIYRDLLVSLLADAVSAGVLVYVTDTGDDEQITYLVGPLDDDYYVEMITTNRHIVMTLDKLASSVGFRRGQADA